MPRSCQVGVSRRHLGSDPARRGQTPSGGRVIGFAVSVTHWIEIGGAVPGSISPEATEIYQEGLQLPGVRVVEQGVPNQTLIDMIEANIRLPRTGIGDLNAGLAATAIGEARVREACERYGVELVLASRKPGAYDAELAPLVQLGASPRASIGLDRAARAHAWLSGRDYVSPQDIHAIAPDVLRHRLLLSYQARADDVRADEIIERLLARVPVP